MSFLLYLLAGHERKTCMLSIMFTFQKEFPNSFQLAKRTERREQAQKELAEAEEAGGLTLFTTFRKASDHARTH